MNANTPEMNRQAGVPLSPADFEKVEEVATGDRRDEVHYEPDPDQLVKVSALAKVVGPVPPEEHTPHPDVVDAAQAPLDSLAMTPDSSSVWDARPVDDDRDRSGVPTGH